MSNEIVNPFKEYFLNRNKDQILPVLNGNGLHCAFFGWSLAYVDNNKPIPKKWKSEFYEELSSPFEGYKEVLNEAIKVNGVRFE